MPNNQMISVLLADDHPSTRAGVRQILDRAPEIQIIGEAENGVETRSMLETLRPQVVLLDLQMQNLAPAAFAKWAHENFPRTIILVLTYHRNVSYMAGMLRAGAAGYLHKDIESSRLIEFVRRAADGENLFSREQLFEAQQWEAEVGDKIKRLTLREIDIVKLLIKGKSNSAIAVALNITKKTVVFHLTHISSKLQTGSRFETTLWGMDNLLDNLDIFPYLT